MYHADHIKWIISICCLLGISCQGLGQVLRYDTKIRVDKGVKSTITSISIQINNREESTMAQVAIRHTPHQTLTIDNAEVKDLDGNIIRKLRKKDIEVVSDRSYGTFYEDDLVTKFDLFSSEYPFHIEYAYTVVEDQFLYITYWTPSYREFNTKTATLEIDLPANYDWDARYSDDIALTKESAEGRIKVNCQVDDYVLPKHEQFAPPIAGLHTYVSIIPSSFTYGVSGRFDTWETFGEWQEALNLHSDLLPASEVNVVKSLIEGIDDEHTVISKLYHYLQDRTKYINVSIDVGGLKSYPASYVASNGYGDCKALTTYMKALLKCAGIRSHYTKIWAGENPVRVIKDFPSPQSNHVILMVPLQGGDTIWLENTSNTLPYNYLGTFTQNRWAFVINGDKSQLIKTPKLNLEEVKEERVFTVEHAANGFWDFNVDLNLQGPVFEKLRYGQIHWSESDRHTALRDYIGIEGLEIQTLDLLDYHRDSTFIKFNIKGKRPPQIRKVGNYEVINPLKLKIPKVTASDTRSHPLRITVPIHKKDQSLYHLPDLEGKEIQLPEKIHIESEFGKYKAFFEVSQQGVHVTEEFELKTGDYPLSQYLNFYNFLEEIHQLKDKSSILIL